MSSNPGISAAGAAAGRTAQDPSAGPAAIGGMLQPGESAGNAVADLPTLQIRLTEAVSDITKFAHAMEALSIEANMVHAVVGSATGGGRAERERTRRVAGVHATPGALAAEQRQVAS